jgi:hypothetical protein
LILEEAEKLYNKLTAELTNRVIAAFAAIRELSLPPLRDNNQPKIYNNNQDLSA